MDKDLTKYEFINKLKSLPFVEEIFLFGSRANEMNSKFSDIDLAINCPKASNKEWSLILDIVENADTLLKIDCVRFDTLSDDNKLKSNIVSGSRKLYSKK